MIVSKPKEECDLEPQKSCRFITKMVPHLKPTEECVEVPQEVCGVSRIKLVTKSSPPSSCTALTRQAQGRLCLMTTKAFFGSDRSPIKANVRSFVCSSVRSVKTCPELTFFIFWLPTDFRMTLVLTSDFRMTSG